MRNGKLVVLVSFVLIVWVAQAALAQGVPLRSEDRDAVALKDWAVPFDQIRGKLAESNPRLIAERSLHPSVDAVPSAASHFITIVPCRVVDTRRSNDTYGGPKLVGGTARTFNVPGGPCTGIPTTAAAYSLNFTVLNGEGSSGFLTAYPTGATQPVVSTLNYGIGNLVANAAIVPAGTSASIDVYVNYNVDLIIDINGYFTEGVVTSVNGLTNAVTLAQGNDLTITPSGQTLTVAVTSDSANTPNTVVRRDASGDFSAGNINLSGNLVALRYDSEGGSGAGCAGALGGGGYQFQVCGSMAANIYYERDDNTKYMHPAGVSNLTFIRGDDILLRDNNQGDAFLSTAGKYGIHPLPGYPGISYPVLGTFSADLYVSIANQYTGYFSTGGYNQVSDERMKKDIEDLGKDDFVGMLARMEKVRSVRFRYNAETVESTPLLHVGVTAQSMPPETVSTNGTGMLGINIADAIGYTIGALRGLDAKTTDANAALERRIAERDARIEELKAENAVLHDQFDRIMRRVEQVEAKPTRGQ